MFLRQKRFHGLIEEAGYYLFKIMYKDNLKDSGAEV